MYMKHYEKQDDMMYVKKYIKDMQKINEIHPLFFTSYIKYKMVSRVIE